MLLDPLRDPQEIEPVGVCPVCQCPVWPDDPAAKTETGIVHIDCTEPEEPEDISFAGKWRNRNE